MAQDFERTLTANIDTALADIRATSDSDDAIVGIRMANIHTSQITVDVAITNDGNTVRVDCVPDEDTTQDMVGFCNIMWSTYYE